MELCQSRYIEKLAQKYRIVNSRRRFDTPMESGLKLLKGDVIETDLPYRSLIGALVYVAAATRPDISFATNYLSRFQSCSEHYKYALRILIYLHHTKDLFLFYSGGELAIDCFVDADFAGDMNDRKSTSGFIIRVYGNAVLWKLIKQGAVTSASTHAEYYAIADTIQEVKWLIGLLSELGERNCRPVPVFEDNSGAIVLAETGKFTGKSKFIEIAKRYVYDLVVKGEITMKKVDTKDNLADTLTKPLDKQKFVFLRVLMGVIPSKIVL